MKKSLIIIVVFMFLGVPTLFADQNTDDPSTSFRPCSSWRYNSDVSSYTCSFLGPYVNVKSDYDFQRLENQISDLQRELRYLENRVRTLESSK